MTTLKVRAGPFDFLARLETALAPRTCAYVETLLPYTAQLVHVRWSGEGCWVPLGDQALDLPAENATSYPAIGQALFYPGGFSETEILIAYGPVRFASKLGQLAGNHFLTITEGLDQLPALGRLTLWEGAQSLSLARA